MVAAVVKEDVPILICCCGGRKSLVVVVTKDSCGSLLAGANDTSWIWDIDDAFTSRNSRTVWRP